MASLACAAVFSLSTKNMRGGGADNRPPAVRGLHLLVLAVFSQIIVAKRLRRHMRSHTRSIPDLGSSGNMDVAELGLLNESLHSQAVGMVRSGLAQSKAAARMRLTPGSSPDLNPLENLSKIIQQALGSVEPCTSVQQLAERLKSV